MNLEERVQTMKRFKPRIQVVSVPVSVTETRQLSKKPVKKREENTLPPDTYEPLVNKIAVPYVDEHSTPKEVHVTATLTGDLGLPYVQILQYIDGVAYKGYAKGKTTMFPLGVLDDVIDALEGVRAELETIEHRLPEAWE